MIIYHGIYTIKRISCKRTCFGFRFYSNDVSFWKNYRKGNIWQCRNILDRKLDYNDMDGKMIHAILNVYHKTNDVKNAEILWNKVDIQRKDVYIWHIMMKIYENSDHESVVMLYRDMVRLTDIKPNEYVLSLLLSVNINIIQRNMDIYEDIVNESLRLFDCSFNDFLGGKLLQYYYKLNDFDEFKNVFEKLINNNNITNVAPYNLMLKMYVNHNLHDKCLELFKSKMKDSLKDHISCQIVLNACTYLNDMDNGKYIHNEIKLKGYDFDELNSRLIYFYSKVNNISIAKQIFAESKNKGLLSYNMMMEGYIQHEMYQNAVDLFYSKEMDHFRGESNYKLALNALIQLKNESKVSQIYHEIWNKKYDDIRTTTCVMQFYGSVNNIIYNPFTSNSIIQMNTRIQCNTATNIILNQFTFVLNKYIQTFFMHIIVRIHIHHCIITNNILLCYIVKYHLSFINIINGTIKLHNTCVCPNIIIFFIPCFMIYLTDFTFILQLNQRV